MYRWTTELVLFSGTVGETSSGTLCLFWFPVMSKGQATGTFLRPVPGLHLARARRRALDILDAVRTLGAGSSPLVFNGGDGEMLDEKVRRRLLERLRLAAVPRGFRSSFRDWTAKETDHPREVTKASSAHGLLGVVCLRRVPAGPCSASGSRASSVMVWFLRWRNGGRDGY